jgi:SAM-dependent methyltransferase
VARTPPRTSARFQRCGFGSKNKWTPTLNSFEELALPYLKGEVLDLGCGMGNLSFAAARRACKVTALDASPAAIEHIRSRASARGDLGFRAICGAWPVMTTYLLRFVPGDGTVMRSLTVVSGRRTVSLMGTNSPVFASRPTVRVVAILLAFL